MIHKLTLSSIQHISDAKPGDTVLLKEGVYRGYFNWDFNGLNIVAELGTRVVFDIPKHAPTLTQKAIVTIRGRDNRFIGFEVQNSSGGRQSIVGQYFYQ